jgi:hypothetical protein
MQRTCRDLFLRCPLSHHRPRPSADTRTGVEDHGPAAEGALPVGAKRSGPPDRGPQSRHKARISLHCRRHGIRAREWMLGRPLRALGSSSRRHHRRKTIGTWERPQLDSWVATGLEYAPFRWICSSTKLRSESTGGNRAEAAVVLTRATLPPEPEEKRHGVDHDLLADVSGGLPHPRR